MVNFISKYKFQLWFAGITLLVVVLDQLSKYLILYFNPSWNLGLLSIHLIKNTGAGFGILQNQSFWLGIVSLAAALMILFEYQKVDKKYWSQVLFGILLGGILGNMFDRFFRGFVVDFIDLGWWPAFNIADAGITLSIIGLIIHYWKKK
jgi:signal peptidase II